MSIPSNVAGEIYQRLERIKNLAKEVEAIPNFGADLWTMRKGDKMCQQIWEDAAWVEHQINTYIGTGDGGPPRWNDSPNAWPSYGTGAAGTGGPDGPPRY